MRIGLVTDTHLPNEVRHLGDLGPHVAEFFASVDLILHGGDIVGPSVLEWLEQFAPVLAARGNNDGFGHDPRVQPIQFLDVEGWRIGMRHDLEETDPVERLRERSFGGERVDIMISGHTHYERLDYREGAVIINSGSPVFPRHLSTRLGTVGLLDITRSEMHAEIVVLGHTEGKPNPGEPMLLRLRDDRVVERTNGTG